MSTLAGMTRRFAHDERLALADSLLAAGPDAPTVCEGWQTRDLAAHIVLRERRPDAALGIMLKPLHGHLQQVQDKLAAEDYVTLVGKVRFPQALSLLRVDALDEAMNLIEFFIHHEDVRRGSPGWAPRELPADHEEALRHRVRGAAKLSTRRFAGTVVVHSPGLEPFEVGAGGERLEVRGAPGELLLFFAGRQRVADVEISGPDGLAERLKVARLGL
jgi:uncharacterized protein (TIGR03085 family)